MWWDFCFLIFRSVQAALRRRRIWVRTSGITVMHADKQKFLFFLAFNSLMRQLFVLFYTVVLFIVHYYTANVGTSSIVKQISKHINLNVKKQWTFYDKKCRIPYHTSTTSTECFRNISLRSKTLNTSLQFVVTLETHLYQNHWRAIKWKYFLDPFGNYKLEFALNPNRLLYVLVFNSESDIPIF